MTRLTSPRNYKYGFYSPNLDAMVDLTNIFYKKKPHVFHAYAIGGVGIAAGRGRQVESDGFTSSGHSRFTVDYRAGLQLEARIKNRIGIFVEGLAINMHDHNRPQLGEAGEWRIQTMLGLNFHLGGKKRVAKPAPVATPIPTPAKPEPAAEPVKKEEPKAKPKLEPKPQPQSQPAPVLEKRNAEIFFSIGSSKVSSAQEANVAAFAEWLNNHPKARVVNVTGYADAGTGTAAINKRVSRQRAEAVVRMLVDKYGIAADRIDENAVGDTVQPYAENDRNRVVIATAEEK